MERLNLITFASVFQKQEEQAIRTAHQELFATLDQCFDVNIVFHGDLDAIDLTTLDGTTVIFIATGGTEGQVVKHYDKLPKPTILLTDGKANSLAASLELSCWIRQKGEECQIIHGDMEYVKSCLNTLVSKQQQTAISPVAGMRIGVIGQPSEWLVASGVDYVAAKKRWGVEYVDIPLAKVEQYFDEYTEDTTAEVEEFVANAQKCIEPTKEEIGKAYRLYHALKRVATEENLDALTLQCFSLIPTTHTTGCLALSLLNDEGIVAGCEGDLQSVFTMLLAKKVTGIDGFMANPARIDIASNTLIIAHCTIGLRQTQQYIIRSHFESLSGVAIQGILPTGKVTVVKYGGKDLSKRIILTGEIIENQDDPHKCRTQLLIRFDSQSPVSYFLDGSIGNHHIVLIGDHRDKL